MSSIVFSRKQKRIGEREIVESARQQCDRVYFFVMPKPSLLVVDDEPNILAMLRRALELEGYLVEVAGSGRLALEKLKAGSFQGVLLDVMMPEMDGLATLRALRESHRDLPVVMMSGSASLQTAVDAVRHGACDFLEKPLTLEKVLLTIQNALRLAELERESAEAKRRARAALRMIGSSARMKQIFDLIAKAAPSVGRVLITGERGTGKELVARAVHEQSRRNEGPFIKLNCAAIPSELIESELFGHEKGAFTGATQERIGRFEQAHEGTLFLDEIGDMTPSAQAKVLRVLQEGEVERVGGSETIRVDVRVIAASNKDLRDEIEKGRFRADLYDRLNVVPIELPPLREHKEDIPALVEHFVGEACVQNGKRAARVSEEALTLLMQHDWPGNVRELRNIVERLCIFADDIAEADVRSALPNLRAVRAHHRPGTSLKDLVMAAERAIVREALEAHGHHMANTARELGLERSHLYKKMRVLGLRPRGDESEPD